MSALTLGGGGGVGGVLSNVGGPPVIVDVGIMASGNTPAADYSVIQPDGTNFPCALKRATTRLTSGGLIAKITNPGSTRTPVEGETPSTLRATLRVMLQRGDDYAPMSEPLLLCDHAASPPYLRDSDEILSLTSDGINEAVAGDIVVVLYEETGDLGADQSDPPGPLGLRPMFLILDWPLVAVSI
jgi:hypothetical protein